MLCPLPREWKFVAFKKRNAVFVKVFKNDGSVERKQYRHTNIVSYRGAPLLKILQNTPGKKSEPLISEFAFGRDLQILRPLLKLLHNLFWF